MFADPILVVENTRRLVQNNSGLSEKIGWIRCVKSHLRGGLGFLLMSWMLNRKEFYAQTQSEKNEKLNDTSQMPNQDMTLHQLHLLSNFYSFQ